MPKLSVILPCYNESKSIHEILDRFSSVRTNDSELILVNNGSTDNTAAILKTELKNPKYKFARSVTIKKNQGYGHGIVFGLKNARGEFMAFSHADLQCDPSDIFRAYRVLNSLKNPDTALIKGNRTGRKNFLTSSLHVLAALLFLRRFDDINGQPKVFHCSLLQKLKAPPKDFSLDFYVQYTALKHGYSVISVPVKFIKRKHGQSHWASTFKSRFKTISGFVKYMVKLRVFGD